MFTKQRFVHALLLTVCCVSIAIGEPTVDGLPRTVWAGKLPGGPVKAVFLAPYAAQQDSFELVQRFDIEGTVVTMSSRLGPKAYDGLDVDGHYWPEFCPTREEVIEDIRGALSGEWEAVVMSRIPSWSTYPPDIRRSILEKVSSGRSLMIGVLDGALLEEVEAMGLELEESTIGAGRFPFSGHDRGTAGVYRCGKGFIAHFYAANNPVRGYLLSRSVLESDFEFSAARAGWLLRRLSRPDARSYLTGTRFADGSLVVELKAGAAPGAAVQIAIHRRDTYEKVLDAVAKAKPGKLVTARLPRVPGGEYQAHIRVTNRKGVTLDWDAIRFTVSGRVQFQALTVDRNEVKPGEKVSCRLDVAGETAGLETVVRWVDNWGRLLLETPPRPFSQDVEITAPGESLSVINRLEVTIHSDDGPEAVARAELLMPQNVEPADFYMVYWKLDQHHGAPPLSWGRRLQWDALRRRGAADSWANCAPVAGTARNAALCHLQTVPYTTSLHRIALYREDGSDSLLNAEWVANVEKNARKAARALRPYTPLAYTLGDENCVIWTPEGRFADTPGVWAAFRAYLRDVYPDLEALNAQWGTDFAAWDDIRFDSEQQMLPSMDNPSAWVDYRMLVTRHFADAHQRMRRAICEEDPGASVGWDGTTQFSTYDGIDWWEMCRDMGMVNTYHRTLTRHHRELFNGEAIGSFTRDARLRGCFLNGADRKYGGSYVPWYLLLKGWNSAWWWYATRPHPINGALRWDLDLTPIVEPMVAAVKEIKQGPGTLLAHARKDVSPIAVHYSATNWHASAIESGVGSRTANLGGDVALWMSTGLATRLFGDEEMARIWGGITPKGHCAAASANFYALLRDIGFEPRTMARQEIEAGALTQSGTRLLILPFVVSLSDLEAAKIREFMMGGGVLIADYRCGLRDEHGRLRETPALDDVFGIRRESLDVRRARGTLVADIAGGVQFESIFRDPVVADGARVRACHDDGTPALFMHHYAGGSTDSFGWYRLRVKTPAAFAGKRLYLVFGAVDEDTHLYINGTKVFEHSCASTGLVPNDIWQTPFSCDVTEFLRPGEEDLLAVGVYNRASMGGIYKPVYMVAAEAGLDLAALQQRVRDGADVLPLPAWRFALDVGKRGIEERWYAMDVDDTAWAPMRADRNTGWQGQGFSGGEAVYLNTDLYGYLDLRRRGQEQWLRDTFASLIVSAFGEISLGFRSSTPPHPPFKVMDRYGSPAGRMETTRLIDGDTWYYGVLPSFDVRDRAPREVILPFPEGRHVYDVRARKYLGPGGPMEHTLHAGRPEMYAALPYAVKDLSLRAPQEATRGEPVEIGIAVAAATDDVGPHAVSIEVNLPDGRKVEYLGRTLYMEKGEGVFSFVPALNSAVGQWTVSAVEAVSGKRAAAHFEIQ